MLQLWHRVTNLSDETIAEKALLENVHLRTNWIKTIEKLFLIFRTLYKAQESYVVRQRRPYIQILQTTGKTL